ncbi:MAG: hypothetical protein MUE51_05920 [Thermoleophilia bacterium]|nr:hypothetical protein [Thermoleophilia bacterium]
MATTEPRVEHRPRPTRRAPGRPPVRRPDPAPSTCCGVALEPLDPGPDAGRMHCPRCGLVVWIAREE